MSQSTAGTLIRLVRPSSYSLRNFYMPVILSLSMFLLFCPGWTMNFRFMEGVRVPGNGSVRGRDVMYHSILFTVTTVFMILLLSAFRMWPGTQ